MPEPTFSVVIPTYNRAALLPKTLASVFAQVYPRHEIIVVDNCSTDDTEQVLAPLIEAGKIRYVRPIRCTAATPETSCTRAKVQIRLYGGAGNDTIRTGADGRANVINCGTGADTVQHAGRREPHDRYRGCETVEPYTPGT